MPGTRLFKDADLYRNTRKQWDPRTQQIVTATAKGEPLVNDTLSIEEQLAIRDGLLIAHPLPAPEPEPEPEPTAPFALGAVLGSFWPGLPAKAKAAFSPTLGRIGNDVTDAQTQQMVRECQAAGIEPHICVLNRPTPLTPTEFAAFVKRYLALGVRTFEIENETSYVSASQVPSTAAAYAKRVQGYGEALKAAGVTGARLLVQADDALRNAGWVRSMFAAVPNLADYVFGWVVHPYTAGREVERLNKAVSDLQAQGVTDPAIYATEYGIAATVDGVTLTLSNGTPDNYGHATNMTTRVAGPLVVQRVEAMRAGCRHLRGVWIYHATNGRGAHNLRETNYGQMTWPDLRPITDRTEPLKAYALGLA